MEKSTPPFLISPGLLALKGKCCLASTKLPLEHKCLLCLNSKFVKYEQLFEPFISRAQVHGLYYEGKQWEIYQLGQASLCLVYKRKVQWLKVYMFIKVWRLRGQSLNGAWQRKEGLAKPSLALSFPMLHSIKSEVCVGQSTNSGIRGAILGSGLQDFIRQGRSFLTS